jgi:hypothetical protein
MVNARDHLPLAQRSYLKQLVEDALTFVPEPWCRRTPDSTAGPAGDDGDTAQPRRDWSEVPRRWVPYFRRLGRALNDFNLATRLEDAEENTEEERYALRILTLACQMGWADDVFRRPQTTGPLTGQRAGGAHATREEAARVNVESGIELQELLGNLLVMHRDEFRGVVESTRRITGALAGRLLASGAEVKAADARSDRSAATAGGEESARVAEPADGTNADPVKEATRPVHDSPEHFAPNLFVKQGGNRYLLAFGSRRETVPALAGLLVAEYLLKQPGKAAHVLEINRALCDGNPRAAAREDAFAQSTEQAGLDGFTADASRPPNPCSEGRLGEARELVQSLEDQATAARAGGLHERAEELEHAAELARKSIREQETLAVRKRRGQSDRDSEVEKVRLKLTNNLTNACKALRTRYGFSELADHLEAQIDSGTNFKYRPTPGIEWSFDPKPC